MMEGKDTGWLSELEKKGLHQATGILENYGIVSETDVSLLDQGDLRNLVSQGLKTICVAHNLLLWIKHTHSLLFGIVSLYVKMQYLAAGRITTPWPAHPLSIFTCTTIRTRYCPENIRWGTEGWKVPTLRNLTGVRLRRVQELQA